LPSNIKRFLATPTGHVAHIITLFWESGKTTALVTMVSRKHFANKVLLRKTGIGGWRKEWLLKQVA
jgi:hypothetical protein